MTEGENLEDARTLVIAYGSVARSARQAVRMCRRHKVGLLTLKTLWPFPRDEVMAAAHEARRVIFPEMNMGQLVLETERLIGRQKVRRVNRADGQMITPDQIRRAIEYKE